MATAMILSSPTYNHNFSMENASLSKRKRCEDDFQPCAKRMQLRQLSDNHTSPLRSYYARPIAQCMPRRTNSIQQTSNRLQHITSNHTLAVQRPHLDLNKEYTSILRIISSAEANINLPSVEAASHAMMRIVCIMKGLPRRLDASATFRSRMNALSLLVQIASLVYGSRSYPFGWHLRAASRKADPIRVFNQTMMAIFRGMSVEDAHSAVNESDIHGQSLFQHLTTLAGLDEWERAFGVEEAMMHEVSRAYAGSI